MISQKIYKFSPYNTFCHAAGYDDNYSISSLHKLNGKISNEEIKSYWFNFFQNNKHLLYPAFEDVSGNFYFLNDPVTPESAFEIREITVDNNEQKIQITRNIYKNILGKFKFDGKSCLCKIAILEFNSSERYLLIIFSHYILDANSFTSIFREFTKSIESRKHVLSEFPGINSEDLFKDYLESIEVYTKTKLFEEKKYWETVKDRLPKANLKSEISLDSEYFEFPKLYESLNRVYGVDINFTCEEREEAEEHLGYLNTKISSKNRNKLKSYDKSRKVRSETALLWCIYQSLSELIDGQALYIDILTNTRTLFKNKYFHIKTHLCGVDFGSSFLEFNDISIINSFDDLIKIEQKRKLIPSSGIGARYMRYRSSDEELNKLGMSIPLPKIELNYLAPVREINLGGVTTTKVRDADIYPGMSYDPTIFPYYLYYDIDSTLDGVWNLNMRYNKRFYTRETAKEIIKKFNSALMQLPNFEG